MAAWLPCIVRRFRIHWQRKELWTKRFQFNSLQPSDTKWWYRSGLTSAQVMACYLMVPCHYQNHCIGLHFVNDDTHPSGHISCPIWPEPVLIFFTSMGQKPQTQLIQKIEQCQLTNSMLNYLENKYKHHIDGLVQERRMIWKWHCDTSCLIQAQANMGTTKIGSSCR